MHTLKISLQKACRRLLPLLLIIATAPAMAQIATFMKIEGLPGESTDIRHANEIDLLSYSQTFGTRNCSRAVAVKRIDRASPGLISRAAANTLIPQVVISMAKVGGKTGEDFFHATLDLVLVERIELSQGGSEVLENVVMAPRSIKIEYRQQRADGGLGPWIVSTVAC